VVWGHWLGPQTRVGPVAPPLSPLGHGFCPEHPGVSLSVLSLWGPPVSGQDGVKILPQLLGEARHQPFPGHFVPTVPSTEGWLSPLQASPAPPTQLCLALGLPRMDLCWSVQQRTGGQSPAQGSWSLPQQTTLSCPFLLYLKQCAVINPENDALKQKFFYGTGI
jgi:hypothetical protein